MERTSKNNCNIKFRTLISFLTLTIFLIFLQHRTIQAQATHIYTQSNHYFQIGQKLFQEKKYAIAIGFFQQTIRNIGYFQETNQSLTLQDSRYYYAICSLKLGSPNSLKITKEFIQKYGNSPRAQMASFKLANIYFQKNRFQEAIPFFLGSGLSNLSNNQITESKFKLAYCYFNLKDFRRAKQALKGIYNIPGKFYFPSNYYFGFISFLNKNYNQALISFRRVENVSEYQKVIPFYIAEILFIDGTLDTMLNYVLPILKNEGDYYDLNLRYLVGQVYFQKKEYSQALPFLQDYAKNSKELTIQEIFELSFCFYKEKELNRAIRGFKQLSGTTDSIGQYSMYLLGDCYLKIGKKNNARNAFELCARNNENKFLQEISRFLYGKLSYELGFQDVAIRELENFIKEYPESSYDPEVQELLVHLFMNTNDYKSALIILQSIKAPNYEIKQAYQKVTYGRAMQLINDGKLDSAESLLNSSLNTPIDPKLLGQSHFWEGEILYRKNQINKAIIQIKKYLDMTNPREEESESETNLQNAHYNLGYCYIREQDYQEALNQFQMAQKISGPKGKRIAQDAILREGDCYFMMKNYSDALNIFNQIIVKNQQGADYALYQKSIIYGIQGNYDQKIKLLKEIQSNYPNSIYNSDVDFLIGLTYMDAENYNKAILFLKNVINSKHDNPDVPKAMLKVGLAYTNLNNTQKAMNFYKRIIQYYPNSTESDVAISTLKNLYINNGNPQEYFTFMNSSGRNLNPSTEDSITYEAAEAKFGNGDYPRAIQAFDQYLKKFPKGVFIIDVNFYKAESLFNQKDYQKALIPYEYVLSQGNTKYAERCAAQAANINFYEIKNYSKADSEYKRLLDLSSSKATSLDALRGLLASNVQLDSWKRVIEESEQLLSQGSISTDDQIEGNFFLGKAYKEQNNCDSAINKFRIVSKLSKSEMGAEARYNIAECLFLQNNLKEAEPAAFDVIKTTPSYDFWVAKSYILLGNIYFNEKDFFNAKATLQSVVDHCTIKELVGIAQKLLDKVISREPSKSGFLHNLNTPDSNNFR